MDLVARKGRVKIKFSGDNQTVSGDKLLHSYHKKFPTLTRDSQTLKSCWINYKKSASFLRFSDK